MATLDDNEGSVTFTAALQTAVFIHSTSRSLPETRLGQKCEGILIDTEAAKGSSVGSNQYKVYCKYVGQDLRIIRLKTALRHSGTGFTKTAGPVYINFLIDHSKLSFDAHVSETDTPILLSIDNMDRLGIFSNNLNEACSSRYRTAS